MTESVVPMGEPQAMSRCLVCGQYAVPEYDTVESDTHICGECTAAIEECAID